MTVALNTTQPLPAGGAVHSTWTSVLGMALVCVTKSLHRSLNLAKVSPINWKRPTSSLRPSSFSTLSMKPVNLCGVCSDRMPTRLTEGERVGGCLTGDFSYFSNVTHCYTRPWECIVRDCPECESDNVHLLVIWWPPPLLEYDRISERNRGCAAPEVQTLPPRSTKKWRDLSFHSVGANLRSCFASGMRF